MYKNSNDMVYFGVISTHCFVVATGRCLRNLIFVASKVKIWWYYVEATVPHFKGSIFCDVTDTDMT
jgi:hypothetical protein